MACRAAATERPPLLSSGGRFEFRAGGKFIEKAIKRKTWEAFAEKPSLIFEKIAFSYDEKIIEMHGDIFKPFNDLTCRKKV